MSDTYLLRYTHRTSLKHFEEHLSDTDLLQHNHSAILKHVEEEWFDSYLLRHDHFTTKKHVEHQFYFTSLDNSLHYLETCRWLVFINMLLGSALSLSKQVGICQLIYVWYVLAQIHSPHYLETFWRTLIWSWHARTQSAHYLETCQWTPVWFLPAYT